MKLRNLILTILICNISLKIDAKQITNKLRVISFNLNEKLKNKKSNLEITKLLKEIDGDIICLQEASQKKYIKELSIKLGLNWNNNAWHKGGMTILSKFKILDWKVIDIPKSYYNALVAIKIISDIWILSIHLFSEDYLINDNQRLRELNFILNKIDELNLKKIILAGDFNSTENSKVGQLLDSRNYIDTHKNQKWCKGTWMPSLKNERIDRIHVKGKFKILNGKVIDNNDIEWMKNIGWPTGEDHRLIVTDLQI